MQWYLGLKSDGTAFPFSRTGEGSDIVIPSEFSGNPNLRFRLVDFIVFSREPVVEDKNITWAVETKWANLTEFKPLNECISPNVDKKMEYRASLVGKVIKVDDIPFKIVSMVQHLHCLTRYNIQNLATLKWSDIEFNGTTWSKEKVVVENLSGSH